MLRNETFALRSIIRIRHHVGMKYLWFATHCKITVVLNESLRYEKNLAELIKQLCAENDKEVATNDSFCLGFVI